MDLVAETCGPGTKAVFQRAEGFELVGSDGFIMSGISEADCVAACKNNKVSLSIYSSEFSPMFLVT